MKMVEGFFLERTGCFSSNNSTLVERLEIKTEKFRKKYLRPWNKNILCYAKCSFIVICFKAQNKGGNVKPRDVTSHLRYFDDAIKFGLRKNCFLCLRYFLR